MSDFDKLLERSADESAIAVRAKHSYVDDGTCQCGEEIGSETSFRAHLSGVFLAVLKRRLLGLLEAGQALADMPDERYFEELSAAWHKQKQAAMEGR